MAEQTQNFNLTKDAGTDYYNIDTANANLDKIDKALGNTAKFEKTGGTGTAITLTGIELSDGSSKTFIASAANNGAATTINSKPLYKPGTTTSPKLIAGKAYTVWYDASGNCFFLKASAEGTASVGNVLAGKTFSNDDDTGITGTMPNRGPETSETVNLTSNNQEYTISKGFHSGLRKIKAAISGLVASVIKAGTNVGGVTGTFTSDATAVAGEILQGKTAYAKGNKATGTMANRGAVSQSLHINGSYTIPAGYHNGSGKVTQSIATKGAQTYTPCTSNQTIAAGQYLNGVQTIKGDANLIPANILSGKSIFGVAGNVVAGKRFASGSYYVTNMVGDFEYADGTQGTARRGYILASGLNFKPSIIVAQTAPNGTNDSYSYIHSTLYIDNLILSDMCFTCQCIVGGFDYSGLHDNVFKANAQYGYVNTSGFRIPADRNAHNGMTYNWIAYE